MIEQSLFVSLSVLAVWATMWYEGIFEFVRLWGERRLPMKLQKPIFECPVCMTPWWGGIIYFLHSGLTEEMPWVLLMAMGWNTLVVKFLPENWYGKED